MKNKFDQKKAEDILTDDLLVEHIKTNGHSEDLLIKDEFVLASDIYQIANENSYALDPQQKEILGEKIKHTIKSYKRKKIIIQCSSAAAMLILILGISVFFRTNNEPDIRVYALNNQSVPMSGNTRLILSGKEEIEINTDKSRIEYAGNGNEIKIDASHQVSQNAGGVDPVMNTLIVPYGKRAQITLSDNSTIWLNSGSKLIYPAKFANDKREVYLEGEAIFEVSHNKEYPFHVVTLNLEVKVLGTVFNLSAYFDDNTTNTVLESGSVELKYKNNSIFSQSKVNMVPGTLAVYNPLKGTVEQTKVNTQIFTSWRDGYFVFEQQPLGSILKKISRYYNVKIQLNDQELASETFSGQLDLRNSASQVLEIIAEIISAKIENIDNQILITRI